jgi:hypothetical protein
MCGGNYFGPGERERGGEVKGRERERERITGDWSKLQNAGLHTLCRLQNVIKVMQSRRVRLAPAVTRMWEMRNSYIILV